MARKKRKTYDDEFRSSCVLFLEAAGYPDKKGALTEVANRVGVPSRTISRWFHGENNPPPDKIVNIKRPELADVFETFAYAAMGHANQPDVIDDMDGKSAVTAAAIATDKMRLLRGLPTEIVAIMPSLLEALGVLGLTPGDVFEKIIQRAALVKAQQEQHVD